VLVSVFGLVLLSALLPDIALDTGFADVVVRITDTATWTQLPYLCFVAVLLVISRHGLTRRRRAVEAGVIVGVMLLALAGNAQLNEHIIKPLFGIPRPNIVSLTESGALASELPDAESFYAVGDKGARRIVLGELLPDLQSPALSDRVRAHWVHETGYAFPSGHSTAAITFAVMLAALGFGWLDGWRQAITTALVPIWAVFVVYSRPLLGVHTPIDVIAGTVVGFGWGLAAFGAIRWTVARYATDRGYRAAS
jgi:phosphatidylglycerophosphatase B